MHENEHIDCKPLILRHHVMASDGNSAISMEIYVIKKGTAKAYSLKENESTETKVSETIPLLFLAKYLISICLALYV